MAIHVLKKGLDISMKGKPTQSVTDGPRSSRVALLGSDHPGLKPSMLVTVGDTVKLGQPVFTDKKTPGVVFTAPAAGTISAINRGPKRSFESLVIEVSGSEEETFASYSSGELANLGTAKVKENLLKSGLWTAFRTRPFGKVPNPATKPNSIFVTAMDSNPLAPDLEVVLAGNEAHFHNGLLVIGRLTEGKVFLCKKAGSSVDGGNAPVQSEEFSGPHPAGNPSTHIHFLDAVGNNKTVWHLGLQDVITIGKLFTTGKLDLKRVISLAGPSVKNPRLLRVSFGADIQALVKGETEAGHQRIVSGSIFGGHNASVENFGFLGRYHQQVTVLEEGDTRFFLGWLAPGAEKFSVVNLFLSKLSPKKEFALTTSTNGSKRAMVPIGTYEKVTPLDLLPTFLLRSLIMDDTDRAIQLGALELDEEDMGLFTFVCPGKYEYGPILRRNLEIFEKEG